MSDPLFLERERERERERGREKERNDVFDRNTFDCRY
jgi:hypothetical protein